MIADCTAIIFAGGQSLRMGQDKATLRLHDETLLQRVVAIVQPIFPCLLVSVDRPRADIAQPQVCDRHTNVGPLAGLFAGLEQALTPWIFAVATDMPFLLAALIEQLARRRDGFDAVIPVVHGHPQTLLGFYSVSCLETLRTVLSGNGKRSLRTVLEQLKVCYVEEAELLAADPDLRSFFDLDTPQDVVTARQYEKH